VSSFFVATLGRVPVRAGDGTARDGERHELLGIPSTGHPVTVRTTPDTEDPADLDGTRATPVASGLAFDRTGEGEPLVLLHGQGFSRRSFDPVVPLLAEHRDVIAVDLPGHGQSPRPSKDAGSAPADLAVAVAGLLDELGLATAHIAGNSSGGWVALELGRLQRARSVTALAPAGLWRRRAPRHIGLGMRQARLNARIVHRLFPNAPRSRAGRALAASQVSGHPFQVPYGPARDTLAAMAEAPGFRETLRALVRTRFTGGAEITVPVTVAFGTRDRVLLPLVSRRRKELPAHTRWIRLRGCGHVPMFDDPRATADLLLGAGGSAT
jgi:pimeloyl-ACP methyl ester carboxylesterase